VTSRAWVRGMGEGVGGGGRGGGGQAGAGLSAAGRWESCGGRGGVVAGAKHRQTGSAMGEGRAGWKR